MFKNSTHTDLFDASGHLSYEGLALGVDLMIGKKSDEKVSEVLSAHLEGCATCRARIFELYTDIESEAVIDVSADRTFKLPKNNNTYFWIMAAAILIVFFVGRTFFQQALSGDEIFNSYFEPYPDIITIKGSAEKDISKAMLYYSLKDYDSAIILFQNALSKNQDLVPAHFYLGISFLATSNTEKALYYLDRSCSVNNRFSEVCKWYLALAYIKDEQMNEAKRLLTEIERSGSFYAKKASLVLKEL